MALDQDEWIANALGSLSEAERAKSIVYLDDRELPADSRVRLGDVDVEVPWPALAFFVDLEPAANWSHSSMYLLVNKATGEVRKIPARMPPFLKGVPPTLHLVWQGPSSPAWAAVVSA
jgi:hypothetical protein